MEKSAIKSCKLACSMAVCLWSIYALVFVLRIMRYAGLITFNVYMGIDIAPIAWYEDDPDAQIAQWIELVGYVLTTVSVLFITLRLIIATRRGIATNQVFTRSNARLLMWLAGFLFLHIFFTDNIGIIYGSRQLVINASPFISCMVVLIVAMLYNMAVGVSEENNLTI